MPNFPWRPVLALLAVVVLCLLLMAYCSARKDAREAAARASVAAAQAQLGQDSADITAGVVAAQNDLERQERENRNAINQTENANTSAGDTGGVGLSVLCSRRMYRDRPECQP